MCDISEESEVLLVGTDTHPGRTMLIYGSGELPFGRPWKKVTLPFLRSETVMSAVSLRLSSSAGIPFPRKLISFHSRKAL